MYIFCSCFTSCEVAWMLFVIVIWGGGGCCCFGSGHSLEKWSKDPVFKAPDTRLSPPVSSATLCALTTDYTQGHQLRGRECAFGKRVCIAELGGGGGHFPDVHKTQLSASICRPGTHVSLQLNFL
jgi:hypothetical protein